MKIMIASLLRHAFTALAGLGGLLFSRGLIEAGDVAQVDASGVSLGAALSVIITAIAGRLLLTLLGKAITGGTGEAGHAGKRMASLALFCSVLALSGCLTSCASLPWVALQSIPLHAGISTDYGRACYSSKSGLTVEVDATSGK